MCADADVWSIALNCKFCQRTSVRIIPSSSERTQLTNSPRESKYYSMALTITPINVLLYLALDQANQIFPMQMELWYAGDWKQLHTT